MATCLISLGANLGERAQTLSSAIVKLEQIDKIRVVRHSRWLETAPAGGPGNQADFLNGAALLETTLSPQTLLRQLQQVEKELGRRPAVRWGPRPIDLDLLLYDDLVLATPELTLPHRRLAFRRFVLAPCVEIAPQFVHPLIDWRLDECLSHLQSAPRYVAVTGCSPETVQAVAQRGAQQANAMFIADPAPGGGAAAANITRAKRRAEVLADASGKYTEFASGFWLEQSRVAAKAMPLTTMPPQESDGFSHDWFTTALRPTLVVWLDEAMADEEPPEPLRRSNSELGRRVVRRRQGPWLSLSATDRETASDEVRAAFIAMR